MSESFFRPAAVSPPFRRGPFFAGFAPAFPLMRAQRALAAAAILARAAADILRPRRAPFGAAPVLPPNKLA